MMVVGGPVAGPGPSMERPGRQPPFRDESSPASTIRNTPGPDPIDTQSKEMDADLTEAQEAAVMGFASGTPRASPKSRHTVLPKLATVQTDYPDCLSIHRPIHAQYNTDTFLSQQQHHISSPRTCRWVDPFPEHGTNRAAFCARRGATCGGFVSPKEKTLRTRVLAVSQTSRALFRDRRFRIVGSAGRHWRRGRTLRARPVAVRAAHAHREPPS